MLNIGPDVFLVFGQQISFAQVEHMPMPVNAPDELGIIRRIIEPVDLLTHIDPGCEIIRIRNHQFIDAGMVCNEQGSVSQCRIFLTV
ncbi:hypothetical protein D3C75_1065980 [compost metagenome]